MERKEVIKLLEEVKTGACTLEQAAAQLAQAPFQDLGYAKPDTHRGLRQGVSEVIYGAGKTPEQIAGIVGALRESGQKQVLITRVDAAKARELESLLRTTDALDGTTDALDGTTDALDGTTDALDGTVDAHEFIYHELPQAAIVGGLPEPDGTGQVVVCAAGTSDLYCAEEAALTAEMLGSRVLRLFDVGVSGIHRLLAHTEELQMASAIVAVAGMEGALASVVGGLAACPVIAVPTSVGYGASLGGIAALLAMLNSCASGVSVVNIDNGFGAGYQAALIDHPRQSSHQRS
ncbi:MAG: nickel pincer cofactor biosynthesis protein LarB [Atopobiaceae bacterium]|nr:nickel pincer cofactor biosynthesis protein LarB [Atopobiaceae bacterium]